MLVIRRVCQNTLRVRRSILNSMRRLAGSAWILEVYKLLVKNLGLKGVYFRKRPAGRSRGPESRKPTRKQNGINKLAPEEVLSLSLAYVNLCVVLRSDFCILQNLPLQKQGEKKMNGGGSNRKAENGLDHELPKQPTGLTKEACHVKNASQGDDVYPGPLQVSGSSGFAWAKKRMMDSSLRSRSRSSSRSLILESSGAMHSRNNLDSAGEENCEGVKEGQLGNAKGHDSYETFKRSMLKKWSQLERPDSFDASEGYHSQELSMALYHKEEASGAKRRNLVRPPSVITSCSYVMSLSVLALFADLDGDLI